MFLRCLDKRFGGNAIRGTNGSLLDYYQLDPKSVGRTIYIKRTADSSSKKYGGKTMFMFDVLLSKV